MASILISKLYSGKMTPDMSVVNARTGNISKLGHLYTMCGKKATEVKEVCCGDIAAVSKMVDTRTNDSPVRSEASRQSH